ncbi:hypothetical protein ACIBAG_35590 [Streptomyces sp. NPDC051243]|uniref:hypothetical protein n=1 Tax=Streptomyces sp. NPDC051243 TaxID=3365646 RepID=UPI0037A99711
MASRTMEARMSGGSASAWVVVVPENDLRSVVFGGRSAGCRWRFARGGRDALKRHLGACGLGERDHVLRERAEHVLAAQVVVTKVQNPGSRPDFHGPDGCVVLAGQAVETTAGEAGDAVLLTDPYVVAPVISQPAALGVLPTLRAATDPGVVGGQYYGPSGTGQLRGHPGVVTSGAQSYDAADQDRLWAVSEELTDVKFSV